MSDLSYYNSVQELKNSSKSIEVSPEKVMEHHEQFERFINFLKDDSIKSASPSKKKKPLDSDTVHGL